MFYLCNIMENKASLHSWIQLIVLGLIWGSSFILIKKCLTSLTPIQVASFRIGIACLASMPFVFYNFKTINWANWPKFLFVGLATTGIPSFCFAIAQTKVPSSTAGILNSLTPIFTMLISVLIYKAKFEWSKSIGLAVGFLGAAILVYGNTATSQVHESNMWYNFIILVATVCYGFNANAVKQYFPNTSSIEVTSVAFFIVGLPAMLYLIFHGDVAALIQDPNSHMALGAVTILSLLCTVIANIVFYNLVQNTNVIFGSSVTFLIPVAAVFWGLLDGEKLSIYHLLAMICISIALYIIRKK